MHHSFRRPRAEADFGSSSAVRELRSLDDVDALVRWRGGGRAGRPRGSRGGEVHHGVVVVAAIINLMSGRRATAKTNDISGNDVAVEGQKCTASMHGPVRARPRSTVFSVVSFGS